jgi:membrane-bound metal-dependent hydrolase YbcI (DUF457 family)
MYLGHYAVALAAKRASPNTSLGTLIAASQFIDIIWPLLVLVGLEKVTIDPGNTVVTPLNFVHYPFTHSLLSVLIWASLFASLYWLISGNRTGTLTVWLAVLSHWALDFFSHAPDLPLYPGSEKMVGLGLWNSLSGTLAFELGIFILGVILYLRTSRPANRTGTFTFVMLMVFLLATYFIDIFHKRSGASTAGLQDGRLFSITAVAAGALGILDRQKQALESRIRCAFDQAQIQEKKVLEP